MVLTVDIKTHPIGRRLTLRLTMTLNAAPVFLWRMAEDDTYKLS